MGRGKFCARDWWNAEACWFKIQKLKSPPCANLLQKRWNEDFRRSDSHILRPSAMRTIENENGFKILDSCWEKEHSMQHQQQNYLQGAHSRAAAKPTCSSSSSQGMQQQQAAEATSSRKHQLAECCLSCALLGTRWNQHPNFFVVLFIRDQAERQK